MKEIFLYLVHTYTVRKRKYNEFKSTEDLQEKSN